MMQIFCLNWLILKCKKKGGKPSGVCIFKHFESEMTSDNWRKIVKMGNERKVLSFFSNLKSVLFQNSTNKT